MAIVNSAVIGSGSQRIGEIVLSRVKDRTIAKKYQPYIHDARSPEQVNQRNRMANCIQLYQALSHAVSVGFTNKGKYQSVYNAFTSKNVPVMSMVRYDTLDGIIVNATGLITVSTGNLGTPVVKYADVYMDINFAHFRERLAVGDKVRLFGLDLSGYVVLMQEYGLTRGDLDLGSLHLEFVDSMPSQQFKCGAIMYKENGGGSTNAALLDWGNAAINA